MVGVLVWWPTPRWAQRDRVGQVLVHRSGQCNGEVLSCISIPPVLTCPTQSSWFADHQPEAARHAVHGRAIQLLPTAAGEAENCQDQSEGEH